MPELREHVGLQLTLDVRAGRQNPESVTYLDRNDLTGRTRTPFTSSPRPFLRWAGSKRYLLPTLVDLLPDVFGTYWEPFLGGGSLLFLLKPKTAVVADSSAALIETYETVRDDVEGVMSALDEFAIDAETYYKVRASRPQRRDERAARFIYLNKTCWNGLYRVNSSGEFNVPYGRPRTTNVVDPANLRSCSELLRSGGIAIRQGDFETSLLGVQAGDLVFLDPPYVTQHNNNGFVDYNETLFAWRDQERLAKAALRLAEGGVHVVVTNASHREVVDLYSGFVAHYVKRSSTLAADRARRGPVDEVVLTTG